MSDETLDDLLSDKEPEPIQEPEPTEPAEPEGDEPTEPAGEKEPEPEPEGDKSTGEKEGEPPSSETENLTEREKAYYAKSKDEARKRQELERELAKLREGGSKETEKAPDPFEDPEGYSKFYDQRVQQVELKTKVSVSQAWMRRQHEDYDQVEAKFEELVKEDPSLMNKALKSDMPAEFVYNHVKKHEKFSKFDSFDDAVKSAVEQERTKLEKSLREQLQKEYDAKLKKADSLPPSGAGGSLGSDTTTVTHESLSDILGEKK